MRFTVTADTDIGIAKGTNQDSVLFKHGTLKWSTVYSSVQRVPSYNYGVENNSIHR